MPRRVGGMRSRASALLVPTAVAALVAASPAHATPARLLALGGGDHISDASEVFRWPGAARDDADNWCLDSGRLFSPDAWAAPDALQDTGPAAAVGWNPGGPDGKWTAGLAAYAFAADADHAGLHREGPGRSLACLAGRRVGPVDIAATWRVAFGAVPGQVGPADEYEHHRNDVGVGARVDLSPGAFVDVAGDLRRERNLAVGGAAALDPSGDEAMTARGWSARARAFVSIREHVVLTPTAEYLDEVIDGTFAPEAWWLDAPAAHHDLRLIRLGVALTWLPDPDRLFAVSYERSDIEGRALRIDPAANTIPFPWDTTVDHLRLAAEQRVNWWLSLRASAGLVRHVDGSGYPDDDYHVDVAGGAALHLGAWGLDLAAGSAPVPEPRRWLSTSADTEPGLRASLHREF